MHSLLSIGIHLYLINARNASPQDTVTKMLCCLRRNLVTKQAGCQVSNTGVRSVGARLQSIVFREVRFIRREWLIINRQAELEPVKCYLENNRICMPVKIGTPFFQEPSFVLRPGALPRPWKSGKRGE